MISLWPGSTKMPTPDTYWEKTVAPAAPATPHPSTMTHGLAAAICNALVYSAAEMLDPTARGWK